MKAEQLLQDALELKDSITTNRRYLHTHPGTGFDIEDTISFVKKELKKIGYEPHECGKAGLTALAGGKKSGKVFMIRCDMDALPIKEEADIEFRSENGNMHACGHDMHTAMLLGAANLLKRYEDEIEGTIKLMFQPAEEIFEASKDMIESGLLENPNVDAALMIHVMAAMPFKPGTVIVSSPGISAPCADYFEINIQGKGCHGSMPDTGVDPINAAAHILIALQEINSRELPMSEQAVLTIGTIHAGKASNVIPDTSQIGGSIRAFDEQTRNFIKQRLTEISEGIAASFRANAEVKFTSGCPALVNDSDLSECTQRYVEELLGKNMAFSTADFINLSEKTKSSKSAGSEDFAYISHEVPSIMLALAAGQPQKGYKYPQHHPMVKFDETALAYGSAIYTYTAMRWLMEHK